MGFSKRTIKDRVATGDNKFVNSGDATDLVLTPNPDSVSEAGTPVNADLLQRYENGLYAVGNNLDGGDSVSNDANNNHANGVMGTRMTMRSDTASNWEANNPVLAKGEIGFDTTNNMIKVGDGSNNWNTLEFITPKLYRHNIYIHRDSSIGRSHTIFLTIICPEKDPITTFAKLKPYITFGYDNDMYMSVTGYGSFYAQGNNEKALIVGIRTYGSTSYELSVFSTSNTYYISDLTFDASTDTTIKDKVQTLYRTFSSYAV